MSDAWWQEGVLYRLDPGGPADAAGNGHGDPADAGARLDHLAWLGVDGVCVSPALPGVDAFVAAARARGIATLVDVVPERATGPRAVDGLLSSWLERGAAGFCVDVAAAAGGGPGAPEVHELLRRWRALANRFDPPALLLGEPAAAEAAGLVAFYGTCDDELNLACNLAFVREDLEAAPMRRAVEELERALPPAAWPMWTGSTPGAGRLASRWARGDEDRARTALMLLLTLRGTPLLLAGDELALPDAAETDPAAPAAPDPPAARTVAGQRADASSVLHLVRDLIGLRRDESDLHGGPYASLPAPDGAWAFRRGEGHVVAVNLSGLPVRVEGLTGRVLICTARARDDERVAGTLELGPWEGAVLGA